MGHPNTMTALEKSHPREGLWMVQAPVPEIGPDEVLIRVSCMSKQLTHLRKG